MSQCLRCHAPIQPDTSFCGACRTALLDWVAWRQLVRPLLETVAPLSTLLERTARSPLPTRPNPTGIIDVDVRQFLGTQVGREAQRWRGRPNRLRPFVEALSGSDDALTPFMTIVLTGVQGRRLTKRYLRRNALHRFEPQVVLEGMTMYQLYDVLFKTCLRTMHRSWVAHRDLRRALDETLRAIQDLAVEYPLLVQYPHFMDSPYEGERTLATISLSGWAWTGLSLTINQRLHEALRKELERRGEHEKREEDLLLALLPSNTFAAWQEHKWHDFGELRTQIVSLLEGEVASAEPQERLSPQSFHKLQQEIAQRDNIASPLEEWSTRQEASQCLDELATRAALSPREAEILALHRQGLTQVQIGARLTPPLPRDTVKTQLKRAIDKMRKAAAQ